jgi:hypothetical protein
MSRVTDGGHAGGPMDEPGRVAQRGTAIGIRLRSIS